MLISGHRLGRPRDMTAVALCVFCRFDESKTIDGEQCSFETESSQCASILTQACEAFC